MEFLYDSGLAVGKASASDGFKALETLSSKQDGAPPPPSSEPAAQSNVPGALFEDKPHSANDAWRKLHTDPLLMIRQREQEALARIKNNPVKMAMIKKSVCALHFREFSCWINFGLLHCHILACHANSLFGYKISLI